MHETPLLDKPVIYGSEIVDLLFIALAVAHAIGGALALLGGIGAMLTRKGSPRHLRAGKLFVGAMVGVATSGIVLDVVRLSAHFTENHTKYAGSGMPSSIPARLAFLFASLCILYFAWIGSRAWSRSAAPGAPWDRAAAALLLLIAVGVSGIIVLQFNPWTGALWMIATFAAAIVIAGRAQRGVGRHRFAMLCLAAFSWWGALQGFGPAIGRLVVGDDPSTSPYVGADSGGFSPAFFAFLVIWAPAFLGAGALHRRYARRRARGATAAT